MRSARNYQNSHAMAPPSEHDHAPRAGRRLADAIAGVLLLAAVAYVVALAAAGAWGGR